MDSQNKNAEIEGRVLFFDVDPSMVSSLKENFQEAGVLVYQSDDPGTGLKIAQKEDIDIVLIDYYPGKTKAVEFLKTIKKKRSSTSRISLNQVQQKPYRRSPKPTVILWMPSRRTVPQKR
jgi:DNA-binding NtrC family response regulator